MENIQYKTLTAFEFEDLGNGEWKITKNLDLNAWNIEIPAQIDDKKIVAIGDNVFLKNEKLVRVKLGYGIKIIGNRSFAYCKSLKQVILPDSIETIGDYAFENTGIREITFPSSLVELGKGVCYDCKTGAVGYEKGLMRVVLPEGLAEIPDHAFEGCRALEFINIPKSVKSIGNGAFGGCSKLKPFDLHEGLEIIGESAFSYAFGGHNGYDNHYRSLFIPKSVTLIRQGAFNACEIDEIAFPKGCEAVLEKGAFSQSDSKRIYIPSSITNIKEIFLGTAYISYMSEKRDEEDKVVRNIWGDKVYETVEKSWKEDIFSEELIMYCEKKSTAFDFAKRKNIKCEDYDANLNKFFENKKLHEDELEVSYQEFEEERIENEKRDAEWEEILEKNLLKEERERLENEEYERKKKEFSREESLNAVDIGKNLATVVVPKHIKVIKEDAFKNNKNVSEIIFEPGSQLVRIERRALSGLCYLEKICLPASLKEIEDEAFCGSKYLEEVKFEQGSQLERIGHKAFSIVGQLVQKPIVLPKTVKYIGGKAFYLSFRKITVPNGCQVEENTFDEGSNIIWVDENSLEGTPDDSLTKLINDSATKLKDIWGKIKKGF